MYVLVNISQDICRCVFIKLNLPVQRFVRFDHNQSYQVPSHQLTLSYQHPLAVEQLVTKICKHSLMVHSNKKIFQLSKYHTWFVKWITKISIKIITTQFIDIFFLLKIYKFSQMNWNNCKDRQLILKWNIFILLCTLQWNSVYVYL